jgi:16S rRNA processing protein RimM
LVPRKSLEVKPGQSAEPMVVMGRVAGPYAVSGWIKVFPYTEYVDGLLDYPEWWLGSDGGEWHKFKVIEGEVHGGVLVASLERCADRDAAARLKGLKIAVPRGLLPALPESGEEGYYWSDLIGLAVINLQGEVLGTVTGLLETGANDVLQVQIPGETERLIPFIDQVILKVDLEADRITVDWGLDY